MTYPATVPTENTHTCTTVEVGADAWAGQLLVWAGGGELVRSNVPLPQPLHLSLRLPL